MYPSWTGYGCGAVKVYDSPLTDRFALLIVLER